MNANNKPAPRTLDEIQVAFVAAVNEANIVDDRHTVSLEAHSGGTYFQATVRAGKQEASVTVRIARYPVEGSRRESGAGEGVGFAHVSVNWPSYGDVDVDRASAQAHAISVAASIGRRTAEHGAMVLVGDGE